MKKKNIFLWWFSNSWNEKKNDVKKKICLEGNWMGYCPFPSLGHDTMHCIMTQQAWARKGWATIQPTTWPRDATTRPAAHARDLVGGESRDTRFCIVTGARAWLLGVVSRYSLYSLCIVIGEWSG